MSRGKPSMRSEGRIGKTTDRRISAAVPYNPGYVSKLKTLTGYCRQTGAGAFLTPGTICAMRI